MATVTRSYGDALGVPNMDISVAGGSYTAGTAVQTGIGRRIQAFKITPVSGATFTSDMGVGGAVEAILKVVSQNATILAYQVETGANGIMSLFVEGNSWTSTTDFYSLQLAIQALVTVNGLGLATATVTGATNLKLA